MFPVAVGPFIKPATAAADYQIARSLRFDGAAYLVRTPGGAPTSRRIGTMAFYIKRNLISGPSSSYQMIYSAGGASSAGECLGFGNGALTSHGDYLEFSGFNSSVSPIWLVKSAGFYRDPTAHTHVVVRWDTTQGTAADRVRIYVNGAEVTYSSPSYPSQNTDLTIGHTVAQGIGRLTYNSDSYLRGTLSDFHYIDGQSLPPTDFGEFDATTGAWKAKAYTGSYGNNGFHLDFSDNSNTTSSTLGKDSSGNGNNWTPNNFSVSAGSGNDSLVDTPTNYGTDTGAGGTARGNYCVWNPIWPGASAPTNGNLDSPSAGVARGTMALLQFDAYWELTSTGGTSTAGVVSNGGTTNTTTVANGKTYGFRLTAAGTLDYINITDAGSWTNIASGLTDIQFPYTSGAASTVASLNAGQRPFAATAPTGFKALCTQNLPTPTIVRPDNYFAVNTRTGNGSTTSVSGLRFQPDLVWIKERNGTADWAVYDSTRGVQKQLETNTTTDETTESTGLTAFNTDGFSLSSLAQVNTSSDTYVDYCWKEGTTPGLDVVTYTGNGSARTISHGLGVTPKFIIVKARTTASTDTGWPVYHASNTSAPETDYLMLNTTAATTDNTYWNDTAPTTSVFSLGNHADVNTSSDTYVAYVFAEVDGFSKFGSYTGNGSADGPFVWCGFRPRWLLLKNSTNISDWFVLDTKRSAYNPVSARIYTELADPEGATTTVDVTSNGFKLLVGSAANPNVNTNTYVFAAFAEHPFKYSRAF